MRADQIPGIQDLSVTEKILLLEELWDNIAADAAAVPVPESHKAELDARARRHAADPGSVLTLDELKQRVNSRK